MIRGPRYVIAGHDLERSARYYRDVLGYEVREIGDPGWRLFMRDQCLIMAGECPGALPPQELGDHSYFAYLEMDETDRSYEAVIARGASVIKELRNEPWGNERVWTANAGCALHHDWVSKRRRRETL